MNFWDGFETTTLPTAFPLETLLSLRGRVGGYLIVEVHVDLQERLLHTYATCYRKKRQKGTVPYYIFIDSADSIILYYTHLLGTGNNNNQS